jgi:hypothetical protein
MKYTLVILLFTLCIFILSGPLYSNKIVDNFYNDGDIVTTKPISSTPYDGKNGNFVVKARECKYLLIRRIVVIHVQVEKKCDYFYNSLN